MPSHTFINRVSGVDWARIIQPMRILDGYKDSEVEIECNVFDATKGESFDWRDVFAEYDAVYFNYTTNDVGYAIMGTLAQQFKRKLICDLDDDIFNIQQGNPAFEVFKKGAWGRTVAKSVFNDVQHLTCTNRHLKHVLMNETNKGDSLISILPNYIDLSLYNHRCDFKDRGYYKAIHFGSSTHHNDLYSEPFFRAMDRVMKEYPNFTFVSVGAFVPKYRNLWGTRYEQGFGDTDVLKWIEKMKPIMDDIDFAVVPLIDNTYNRSKSSIKFLETSSYKIPGVWQDIRQYKEVVKHGENGYLASTEEEWYSSIISLINDSKLRKIMGEKAFETIENGWQQKDHTKEYAQMFKKLLT